LRRSSSSSCGRSTTRISPRAFPDGATLTDALARRDALTVRHSVIRQVAEVAGERQQRYERAEIRILATVDVGALRRQADDLARERRELDGAIQETNWSTDLLE
jgi:uncharacterized protein DUF6847